MRTLHIGKMNLLEVMFILLNVFKAVSTCSPPRTKFGEYSPKKVSLVKRAQNAEYVIIGTVIAVNLGRSRRKVSAQVAMHYQLKGNKTLPNIVTVLGFGKDTEKFGAFYTSHHLDCTDTNVALYGSYIMFLESTSGNTFRVQEIAYKSAVTEIPCKKHFSSKIRRILRSFRRSKDKTTRCVDSKKGEIYTWKKCLRRKMLRNILDEYQTFGLMHPRKVYCQLQKQRFKSLPTGSAHVKMKDFPQPSLRNYKTNKNIQGHTPNSRGHTQSVDLKLLAKKTLIKKDKNKEIKRFLLIRLNKQYVKKHANFFESVKKDKKLNRRLSNNNNITSSSVTYLSTFFYVTLSLFITTLLA